MPESSSRFVGILITNGNSQLLLMRQAGENYWTTPICQLLTDSQSVVVAVQVLIDTIPASIDYGRELMNHAGITWVHCHLRAPTLEGFRREPTDRLRQTDWTDYARPRYDEVPHYALAPQLDQFFRHHNYNLSELLG